MWQANNNSFWWRDPWFDRNVVCVCVCVRERERERVGTRERESLCPITLLQVVGSMLQAAAAAAYLRLL